MQTLGTPSHAWAEVPAEEVSDVIVAALALGGVDHLFFTSGTEIGFYQEAIAKAQAHGRPAPKIITMTHEHASLNAALGYAMVSGKPAATAAHVDAGTFNYGGALHTAHHAGLPVVITAGLPPVSAPDTMRGARDGGHLWFQEGYDQNGIVRNYVKWDHTLSFQDNPGTTVSRALQVAQTEPRGPVYLSFPREIAYRLTGNVAFPTAEQLGIAVPPAPDPDAIAEIAERLRNARNPFVVVSDSGRDPRTVPALLQLCELLALPVSNGAFPRYHCFPMNHSLYGGKADLSKADVVLVLDAYVPWLAGPNAPPDDAYIASIDADPLRSNTPTYEFTADVRVTADPLAGIRALIDAVGQVSGDARARAAERRARYEAESADRRARVEREAQEVSGKSPIDPRWLSYQIGKFVEDEDIMLDETLTGTTLERFLQRSRPGSYFRNPGSSGGWSTGAALGAKLAAPDRDVIAVAGDGFYQYSTANAALWAAAHYKAPFVSVVYQNRSYSTGTVQLLKAYPDSYAKRAGYEGGYFDPPIDLAKEAEAAGAHGENVRDAAEIMPALRRARAATRDGQPAVVAVWLPRAGMSD